MKAFGSARFQIDRTLIARWTRFTAIVLLPVIVLALQKFQAGEIPDLALLQSAFAASLLDFLRRYMTDYS